MLYLNLFKKNQSQNILTFSKQVLLRMFPGDHNGKSFFSLIIGCIIGKSKVFNTKKTFALFAKMFP